MRDQLAIGDQGAAALTRSRLEAYDVARARVLNPHSENTQRAYRQAFERWCSYADAHSFAWGPIDAMVLVTYLEELSRVVAPNTVRLHMTALCELDKATRVSPATPAPQSLREHLTVVRWYESWSRQHPKAPKRRAAALGQSDLERLLAAAAEPPKNAARAAHVQQYVRDRCLILFGVCGAFRGADLVELQAPDVEPTDRGLRVFLRRSKTDQEGEGYWVGLMPQGRAQLCPVDAFAVWRKLRGDGPGPLFAPITRAGVLEVGRGLTERHITRLVTDYGRRAGIEMHLSAHSLRATFATLASARGKPLERIMSHGRWKSADVAAGYVRQQRLFDDNASAGLLE